MFGNKPDWNPVPKVEGIEQVTLDTGRHYVTPNGNKYFSATTMLSVMDDGGIDAWRKRVGEKEAERIVTDAAQRGNGFHDLCEKYLTTDHVDIAKEDPRAAYLFNRARVHIDKFSEVNASEFPLYSDKIQAAGTVDLAGVLDGKFTIGDFKSARYAGEFAEWGKKKIFKYLIQCGFYAIMWYERYRIMPQQACIIMASEYDFKCRCIVQPIKPFMREASRVSLAYRGKYPVSDLAYFKLFGGTRSESL